MTSFLNQGHAIHDSMRCDCYVVAFMACLGVLHTGNMRRKRRCILRFIVEPLPYVPTRACSIPGSHTAKVSSGAT